MSTKVFRVRVRHDCLHEIFSWLFEDPSNKRVRFLNLSDSIINRSPDRLMWMYLECPSYLDFLLFKERFHVGISSVDQES